MASNTSIKEKSHNRTRGFLMCLFLVTATLGVYWQVKNHEFVNFDDKMYVTDNQYVQRGLTIDGLIWSFSLKNKAKTHWHPLTWLSHMLDCELYGLRSDMHHMSNVILHIANTLLLFTVLLWMTGAVWRSVFVAAIFALHPINVDSVAWVAQRKNVLSTFFWMLSMLAYVHYLRRPGFYRYGILFLVFALGLMAKPMLVTLPFVFLLLDYWPLARFRYGQLNSKGSIAFRIVLEKLPLFILSGATICLSSLAQESYGVVVSTQAVPVKLRVANAVVSYVGYIIKMIWPHKLAVFYPYPDTVSLWQVAGAGLLLICVTVLIMGALKRAPYLGVGWLWYLGTLVPVIGLMQVGLWPAMADRWAYVPLIGLFIIIAWGVPELLAGWRLRGFGLGIVAGVVLLILTANTWIQTRYWTNSVTLFEHAIEVTPKSEVAYYNLGVALAELGRTAEAIDRYSGALRINPKSVKAYNNLGLALEGEGKIGEAIDHYSEALRIDPGFIEAHNNLGNALKKQGRISEAIRHYSEALRINPDFVEAHSNLGNALKRQGRIEEAIGHYSEALRIEPDSAETQNNLGLVLADEGRISEAIEHYTRALQVNPDFVEAQNNLGNALAKQGRNAGAIRHYMEALRIDPDSAEGHNNLGAALVGRGDIEGAIVHFQEALRLRPEYAEARINLGNAMKVRKKIDEAIGKLREALKFSSGDAASLQKLGNLYQKRGKLDEAIEQYRKALAIQPDYTTAINNLAVAYMVKKEYNEAVSLFEKVIKLIPESPGAYYNLACIYARQNRVEEAIEWLSHAVEKGYKNWDLIKNDPDLENIRSSAYYKELVKGR
jgi:tetratricopeptide (TPR) repeat protein